MNNIRLFAKERAILNQIEMNCEALDRIRRINSSGKYFIDEFIRLQSSDTLSWMNEKYKELVKLNGQNHYSDELHSYLLGEIEELKLLINKAIGLENHNIKIYLKEDI